MAPNNALGNSSAARLRESYEGRASVSPARARQRKKTPTKDVRVADSDSFGAGGMVSKAEVAARGTGSAVRTPLEEFESRPQDELRCFWTAVMFLTRLPCPGWCDHHPGYLMRSLAYFPLLGAIIGVWAAAWFDAAVSLWPPLLSASISAGATLWLTGCFHEDGLCDTLDAFGGGWTKKQILAIMKDSRNGSYATMAGSLWVLAKCSAIAIVAERTKAAGHAIIAAQALSRASSAPLVYFCEYVVDDEDAKGEYYNCALRGDAQLVHFAALTASCAPRGAHPLGRWGGALRSAAERPSTALCGALSGFADSKRLLGLSRVALSSMLACALAFSLLSAEDASVALCTTLVCTLLAGLYGNSVLGGESARPTPLASRWLKWPDWPDWPDWLRRSVCAPTQSNSRIARTPRAQG